MANNVVFATVALADAWQPLSATPLVATVTISALPANSANATLRAADGSEVVFVPGEWHTLNRVDLSSLQARGDAGDVLSLVGGSW